MQKIATFPKPNDVSVKSTYTYDPPTARLKTLLTQKLVGGAPTDTYQNLDYQQFDGKGNLITLADNLNAITHGYTYDSLDRLLTANGAGANPYTQSYQYNRIGNITFKSDVGNYSYTYSSKPHAVRTAGNISLQYDANGNMTRRSVSGGIRLDITYNYDNKPNLIKKNGSNYVQLTYDGNSQRVKKYNYTTGQTTLYFGNLYETRAGVGTIHLFAGTNRVASVLSDGRAQFYHTDHLGSASVITDSNGNRKEQMVYFPFGTYRAVGNINGTYDFDPSFPDVFYTFTDQEDDDDLGFYNYGARLYDPVLGRFISPDSMVPDPNNPQSLNRYSYALNNPLRYIDPSGNVEWDVEWYDQGEIGSDYGTWGSFGNLSFNIGTTTTKFYNQTQFFYGEFNFIPYYSNNIAANNLAPTIQSSMTFLNNQYNNLGNGLSNFYPGFGDSFTSVFGITSLLGAPSPTESIRLSLGCNDVVDKSSMGYKIGEAANAAWWMALGSEISSPLVNKVNDFISGLHGRDIPLFGNKIINLKLIDEISINYIDKGTFRFEIGYHKFGVPDKLFHLNINGTHYFPVWGWPPWGIKK